MPIDNENSMTNVEQAGKLWQQFLDSPALTETDQVIAANHREALLSAFARSAFLAETLVRKPAFISRVVEPVSDLTVSDSTFTHFSTELKTKLETLKSEDELLKELREYRNQEMARITFLDVLNNQNIEASLAQVSALADALITSAYHWIYQHLAHRYGTPKSNNQDMHMYILGMGKLGGRELNFSSDIDLIFAYPEKGETSGGKKALEHQQFFTKLAQKLIQALNKVTNDGQVYRVDMRLRPFGDSGPLVMHFTALEDYYQDQGRHWERFAMVKARVINDDDSDNATWLKGILHPFTFRRYLDFTTLDALRNMKKLIATEIRRRRLSNNIKLGAGGIREVEFFAQSFQLIHGGREPVLQSKSLLHTLDVLSELDIVESEVTKQLKQDYLFLRKVEHTLQQSQDRQTQTLPDEPWQQNALIDVMGFAAYSDFLTHLDEVMARIHGHFNELVEESHDMHSDEDQLFIACQDAWRLSLQEDEFTETFSDYLSSKVSKQIFAILVAFKDKQRNYRIGQRGEDTLNKLLPEILYVLIKQHPNHTAQVLSRLLGVIEAITGRTTYLDLLLENPDVLKQLVRLCERSDWIAQEIRRFPLLLDELLTPLYLGQQNTDIQTSKQEYQTELRETMLRIEQDDVEMLMDGLRQFKLCQQLRIAASDISESLPINNVSDKLTVLAEVILEHVVNAAWMQMRQRFGVPSHLEGNDKGFAVIGYGKLGGYELGYGSDLDLVFIHNAPRSSSTDGKKSIEAQQFYIKLAQRIMHLLNTKTLFGQLYETDLRLRPSGNAGLLCCHIQGFEKYQVEEAWTWEHQALVRARAICGDTSLLDDFSQVRHAILSQSRAPETLSQDVCKMRIKMREHLLAKNNEKVDLKQCEGGITDIEFIAQYLVLAHACTVKAMTEYPDNLRIFDVAASANIIDTPTAQKLQKAYLLLREQYHHLTLADTKYADQSEELDIIRQQVTQHWDTLFRTQ
ncbi:bifunctional [glutamate--ammonia ligase]-adenylyl-L-tyrosine phosphorylase/[glutamate--ammonia-ligase] adenylyltransferase [Alteromonas sp. BL110]|uniref:bifunctional [glutamate--ammonia ligase]-adenylyl-L-tyrosine phosphorylase/[glutamate--ammonia-ligase] adenylyltransferase n=1 Tax=Alteromonas sp. BL110 TaxID=1714845 RepID=UPI000E52E3E5|nr:bifunctional [glutamate--ammonia ligase]-adenylyl-L-tyrosine phosphorylase/[glutamate--ammonia-ligase] adenylyltransferase [Alteromonas sp. BL110]AXT39628.1 bifunctional [glutamate--ammonia ligase]-adenylyl-L-tyrosine phosphorylase/[glutamate--ammonia-ligase] adenylyltransferase [Alteromonas sp. BL110]RKM81885.1 bifunctional [glutamate--ammonia ligase]-adenylyl-L-tyrosine phosphorylase/[glutamate--ammonia-ligase] adenylyltransferase [Alteromonas sp. BL110]